MSIGRTLARIATRLGAAAAGLCLVGASLALPPAAAAAGSGGAPASAGGGASARAELPDPLAEEEWFYGQRAAPGRAIPPGAYAAAQAQAAAIPHVAPAVSGAPVRAAPRAAALRPAAAAPSDVWQSLGPSPVAGDYWAQGPVSGRVSSIAVAPAAGGQVLYVGSAGGGVWSSSDGGRAWNPLTDNQPSLALGVVAVDPDNAQVIYAGTGEDHYSVDSMYGAGLLKSTDGGATWTTLGGDDFTPYKIAGIAIDPADDSELYVGGTMGLFESTDGGRTWTSVLAYGITALAMNPQNPQILYAAVPDLGIEETTDGGARWNLLASPALPTGDAFGVAALALAPDGTTLYASIASDAAASFGALSALAVSPDGGATWSDLTVTTKAGGSPIDYFQGSSFSAAYAGGAPQGWYDNAIAVDPANPAVLAVGGISAYLSTDGGTTWSEILPIHPDQHALTFDASGDLYVGNDGGVWELPAANLANADGGAVDINGNLSITQMYPGLTVVGDGSELVAGAQDNGTEVWSGSSSWPEIWPGDGMMTAVDPANPDVVYAENGNGYLVKATDGGASLGSWQLVAPPFTGTPNWVAPFVMDPSDPNTLYFGAGNVWKTSDGASTWTKVTHVPASDGTVSAIAVAPNDPQVVYAGWTSGMVMVSADGGQTWRAIAPGPARWVTDIAVSAANPYEVYVAMSGYAAAGQGFPSSSVALPHLFATQDAQDALPVWTDESGDLPNAPVNAVVLDGNQVIVGTDVGVFEGTGGGAWFGLGTGLPNVQVVGLTLAPDGTLYAATHGRGVWDIQGTAPTEGPPQIDSMAPSSGSPAGGTAVTLTGVGFSGATAVDFGFLPAASFTVNAAGTEITAVSPPGGGQVAVTVTSPEGVSDSASFIYSTSASGATPWLFRVAPTSGPPGTSLTLTGSTFGATPGSVEFVSNYVGTVTDQVYQSWSDGQIVLAVPAGLVPGTVFLAVYNATTGYRSNYDPFLITGGPVLAHVSTNAAAAGARITLSGVGFGAGTDGVYVTQGALVAQSSGTPSAGGTSLSFALPSGLQAGPVTLAVYNPSLGFSNALPFVYAAPLAAVAVPGGVVEVLSGVPGSVQLQATGGSAPYQWSLGSGSLPAGFGLDASGLLSGSSTAVGAYPVTVDVADASNPPEHAMLSFTVDVEPDLALRATTPAGTVGVAYSGALAPSGGLAPYQVALTSGSLPPGLTLMAGTGAISGTPAAAGTFAFVAEVTDSGGFVASTPASIAIAAPSSGGGGFGGGGAFGGGGGAPSGVGGSSGGGSSSTTGAPGVAGVNEPFHQTATGVVEVLDTTGGAVTVHTSNYALSLAFPAGSMPAHTTLQVSQLTGPSVPALPPNTALASPVWLLDAGGAEPDAAVPATLAYQLPAGVSPLQLGVYTLVDGAWQFYAGGQVDPSSGTVQVSLAHLSVWAVLADTTTFPDVPSTYWAFRDIEELTAAGIISGLPDGTFVPDGPVTRAEFVKLLLGALKIAPEVAPTQPFADVAPGAWYAGYVDAAAADGILLGSQGQAMPDAAITRQEAAVLLMRAVDFAHLAGSPGTEPAQGPSFTDEASIAAWAAADVRQAVLLGLLQGFPDGTFQPAATLTRAQAATLAEEVATRAVAPTLPPA